jgi:hypothetical protein
MLDTPAAVAINDVIVHLNQLRNIVNNHGPEDDVRGVCQIISNFVGSCPCGYTTR